MGDKLVDQAFNIAPHNVYGYLIAILVAILIVAGWFFKNIYVDMKKTRATEAEERRQEREATEKRFKDLSDANASLQKESIEVLTNVVGANTQSNNELVVELRNSREGMSKLAEEILKANVKADMERQEMMRLLKNLTPQ